MGLFGKKGNDASAAAAPVRAESRPTITTSELANATQLMNQFDAALGVGSDAIYTSLEQIAYRGGWQGQDATMMEAIKHADDTSTVLQRPWRWWQEAARAANASGDHLLAGRIFLFTHLYILQMAPKMSWQNKASVGLETPEDEIYKGIATCAVEALANLEPTYMIHDTATGKVDVASALSMAEQVSGVVATRGQSSPQGSSTVEVDQLGDSNPFNTL